MSNRYLPSSSNPEKMYITCPDDIHTFVDRCVKGGLHPIDARMKYQECLDRLRMTGSFYAYYMSDLIRPSDLIRHHDYMHPIKVYQGEEKDVKSNDNLLLLL